MTNLALHRAPGSEAQAIALPPPRCGEINIRLATLEDIPFIDQLQKQHTKMVGFFPRAWFESNIKTGHVLIAEEGLGPWAVGTGEEANNQGPRPIAQGPAAHAAPLGYCVFKDKYLKREELGIVYQLNVTPGRQRGLIGAALVKAAFERCPWGVKLFCCWCAQDIEANHFWESIGFVPLAFRTGSRPRLKKDGTISKPERMHIFWQRRIREGDEGPASGGTPYWFPSETSGGAVRENRIVLPIPPGTHWSDAKPSVLPGAVLPGMEKQNEPRALASDGMQMQDSTSLPHGRGSLTQQRKKKAKVAGPLAPPAPPAQARGGLWFAPPAPDPPTKEELKAAKEAEKKAKAEERKRLRKEKQKNDPKYVAAARELRDRFLEEVNTPGSDLLLPAAHGKYDVSRQLAAGSFAPTKLQADRLLDAA
jgi:hypothetical protein